MLGTEIHYFLLAEIVLKLCGVFCDVDLGHGANESKFHHGSYSPVAIVLRIQCGGTSTQRCSLWLFKIASHRTISRWPSAKVGNVGGAEKSPVSMYW